MAKQTINIGAAPNDGTGTPLRTAFDYCNLNFTELYTAVGPSGNNIVVPGTATITGDLTVDTSTLKVASGSNQVGVGITTFTGTQSLQVLTGVRISDANPESLNCLNLAVTSTTSTIETRYGTPLIFGTNATECYRIAAGGTSTWSVAGSTAMTLNSTGLGVGISPVVNLDIASASTTQLRIQRSGQADVRVISDTGVGIVGTYSNHTLQIRTNGISAIICDTSQNVGIGVTPSATDSTYYQALEITRVGQGLTGAKNALTSSPNSWLSNNSYATYSAGIVWKYAVSQPAAQYRLLDASHQWYTAPSGTAGNAITFTQAMTLDASGNLLVGTTTNGGNGVSIRPSTTAPNVVLVGSDTSGGTAYQLYSTGTSSNRFFVTWAGTVNAVSATISAISDARLKENVQDIDVGLAAILSLKPRKFDWKAGKGKDIKGDRGFIAQEFEQVFPQLVDDWADPAPEGEAPYKSVRQDLIPVLVKAIQELAAEVNALKNA
jgi:hypothetical protein